MHSYIILKRSPNCNEIWFKDKLDLCEENTLHVVAKKVPTKPRKVPTFFFIIFNGLDI